jgi:hypothetical protein
MMRSIGVGIIVAVSLVYIACGGNPAGPGTGSSDNPTLQVVCPPSLLLGQTAFCQAASQTRAGSVDVTVAASWSSSDPAVASSGQLGSVTGHGGGQVVVSASYGGQTASAHVVVVAQDVLQATASAIQGLFRVGSTVTMTLQGFYGVDSAAGGQLSLVITDQAGANIANSAIRTVARGGDSFILSDTFVIPSGTTQVCRTAVLQIGSVTLTAAGSSDIFPCVAVSP